jgi:hypothetical protein
MPVQRFAPMTKDFATFDCDAHVTEPPLIWERAKDFLTSDELDALKRTIWWDADGRLLIVNGRAGIGLGSPRRGGIPGTTSRTRTRSSRSRPRRTATAASSGDLGTHHTALVLRI